MKKSLLRHIGLQYFAEPAPSEPTPAPVGAETGTGNEGTEPTPTPKTFTQEEVNRLLANEKRQGRQAALRALGLDPNDKDAEKKAKAILDSQKTDAEKAADDLKAAQGATAEAEARALAAEHKLAVLTAGCKADYIEEVTALASAKVTDKVDFEAAIKAVKEKCPAFFEGESDSGTGGGQGHKRTPANNKPGSLGARLAQGAVSQQSAKNPFFD